MAIYKLGKIVPKIDPKAYVHPMAVVIGDVTIDEYTFVAPTAVIRGDGGKIIIGAHTSIQDGVVIHSQREYVTQIGNYVNIGHNATIHAKLIEDRAAIGMGAIIAYNTIVHSGAIIGDGALLPQNKEAPANSIMVGVPAKVMRYIESDDDPARVQINGFLDFYTNNAKRYPKELERID